MPFRDAVPIECDANELIRSLGIEFAGERPFLIDIQKAAGDNIRHEAEPVATVALALTAPALGRKLFPQMTLEEIVRERPGMDGTQVDALAQLCGTTVPAFIDAEAFKGQLDLIVEKYRLDGLYGRYPDYPACNEITWKPRGIDYATSSQIPGEIEAWRAEYRAMPPFRQIMAATVMWLYRGGADRVWLVGQSKKWHAVDAITALHSAGALKDWGRLVALYPGW